MSKKDILKSGVYMPIAIGDTVYLWSQSPAKGDREACVISSHGGRATRAFGTKPKTADLYFYCPDGHTLKDPGVRQVAGRAVRHYEVEKAGTARFDYDLSKFQGSHGGGKMTESYADIQWNMHPEGQEELIKQLSNPAHRESARRDIKTISMDVVTIRNRTFHKSPTLWEVIDMLQKNGYMYQQVHCSFCRVPESGNATGEWDARTNP